jgi:hypothetical protein
MTSFSVGVALRLRRVFLAALRARRSTKNNFSPTLEKPADLTV